MFTNPFDLSDDEIVQEIAHFEEAIPEIPIEGPDDDSRAHALDTKRRFEHYLNALKSEQARRQEQAA